MYQFRANHPFLYGGERGIRILQALRLPVRSALWRNFRCAKRTILSRAARTRFTPERHSLPNGSNPSFYQSIEKKVPYWVPFLYGGERGIRTLGRVLADTRFPVVRLRPAQPSLQVAHSFTIISHIIKKIKTLNQNIFVNFKHFFKKHLFFIDIALSLW